MGALAVLPLPLSVDLTSAFELSDLVVELFAAGSVGLSFVSGMKPAPRKRTRQIIADMNMIEV